MMRAAIVEDFECNQERSANHGRRIRIRATLGLALLLALVVAGHWILIEWHDLDSEHAVRILQAQRLGTGSQRIAKLALAIQSAQPGPARDRMASELSQCLLHWDRAFYGLWAPGDRACSINHSLAIEGAFFEMQPAQVGLMNAAREVADAARLERNEPLSLFTQVNQILRRERENLDASERLVARFEQEAQEQIANRRFTSRFWLAAIVASLAFGGSLATQSAARSLEESQRRLGQLRDELLAARRMAGAVSADYKRLSATRDNGAVQSAKN